MAVSHSDWYRALDPAKREAIRQLHRVNPCPRGPTAVWSFFPSARSPRFSVHHWRAVVEIAGQRLRWQVEVNQADW